MAITRRSGNWQATHKGPDRRERSKTFARKIDAERWLATQQADVARGQWVDPVVGRETLAAYARRWAAVQPWRESTRRNKVGHLEHHILPALGSRPLATLRRSDVRAFVKDRSTHLAPLTVAVTMQTFRSVLRAAVEDRVIASSPANGVKLPSVERDETLPMTREQVATMTDAVPERLRAAVIVAASTGLRNGELFGLTVDRVDFMRRTVRVDRQLVTLPCAEPTWGPPKTTASSRTIPVPDDLLVVINHHLAEHGAGRGGLLFTTIDGRPLVRNASGHVWRRAASAAGTPPGTSWHDLRHHYASLLISAGLSVKAVQSRLGHASAKVTLDTYGHLWPDDDDRTRDAIAQALRSDARAAG